jgi:4-diphosphocytidyl-2-C-methyl-D-erythritol kinase
MILCLAPGAWLMHRSYLAGMEKRMSIVRARAPAKLNLFLHVLAKRADELHELESLVVFSQFGDELEFDLGQHHLSLSVSGPMIGGWSLPWETRDNSVMQAALKLAEGRPAKKASARIHLVKNIPIAAGLGGGTTDAAAALIALNEAWGIGHTGVELERIGLEIGVDVPVCLRRRPTFVSGIGEKLTEAPPLPQLHIVVAHTKHLLPTQDVFHELDEDDWSGKGPTLPKSISDVSSLVKYLAETRNDLEAPAIRLQPQIERLLEDLRAVEGCLLARMSGSGAACFGIFASDGAAENAAREIEAKDWWAVATRLLAQ